MNSPKIYLVLVYTGREGIAGWWAYELISPTPQSASDAPKKKKKRGQKTPCFSVVWRFFEKYSHHVRTRTAYRWSSKK